MRKTRADDLPWSFLCAAMMNMVHFCKVIFFVEITEIIYPIFRTMQ